MFFRELETDRLYLRNISADDRDFIFRQFTNTTVNRYLFDAEPLVDMDGANEIIEFYTRPEPRLQHRWILVQKADNARMGTCGFHRWEKARQCCDVGYDLYPDFWGNGYMREVLRAILEFARNDMRVKRIDACIYPDNAASVRLAESLGFVFEGNMKDEIFRGKKYPHKVYTRNLHGGMLND